MDNQKVEQVLRTMFDQYGSNILKDPEKFNSCLRDLLNGDLYAKERKVLSRAMEGSVLTPLAEKLPLPEGISGRVEEFLISANLMREEDAKFVVKCILDARSPAPIQSTAPEKNEKPASAAKPQKAADRRISDLDIFDNEAERKRRTEECLLRWEEQVWLRKKKIVQYCKSAVIALLLIAVAIYSANGRNHFLSGGNDKATSDTADHSQALYDAGSSASEAVLHTPSSDPELTQYLADRGLD